MRKSLLLWWKKVNYKGAFHSNLILKDSATTALHFAANCNNKVFWNPYICDGGRAQGVVAFRQNRQNIFPMQRLHELIQAATQTWRPAQSAKRCLYFYVLRIWLKEKEKMGINSKENYLRILQLPSSQNIATNIRCHALNAHNTLLIYDPPLYLRRRYALCEIIKV